MCPSNTQLPDLIQFPLPHAGDEDQKYEEQQASSNNSK